MCRKGHSTFIGSSPQWATLFIRLSAKGAANLISYRGVRRITAKVKTVICEQAPNHGSYFAYARLIARVTLKLVWCKNSKNNEFRTKKFPNPEFLYGISSFCTLSENNSFLHGKISCFCIFLAKNGVFNTNRTPRAADGNAALRAMHSIHKCVAKDAPHLLTALRNEPRYS